MNNTPNPSELINKLFKTIEQESCKYSEDGTPCVGFMLGYLQGMLRDVVAQHPECAALLEKHVC